MSATELAAHFLNLVEKNSPTSDFFLFSDGEWATTFFSTKACFSQSSSSHFLESTCIARGVLVGSQDQVEEATKVIKLCTVEYKQ